MGFNRDGPNFAKKPDPDPIFEKEPDQTSLFLKVWSEDSFLLEGRIRITPTRIRN